MKRSKEINPARVLIFGYLGIIAIGTLLLCLPFASRGISFVDALFTATSSLCVTGLIVKDTALDFTIWGKAIILFLIQIGGIGYMTLSTTFFFFLGRRISLRDRLLFKESVNLLSYENLRRFAWRIFRITIVVELIGTILLFSVFVKEFPAIIALGHAFFHSVSAFCNAGFSTFSENLVLFSDSFLVLLTVTVLVIMGGIGFIVISDIYRVAIKKEKRSLSLHTKIVLRTTFILILTGTLFIFLYEGDRSLAGYPFTKKLLHSFFQSVTPRTAGFNTIPIAFFSPITLVLLMLLMFIGASPAGTGGGIKTSSFALLILWARELLLGRYNKDVSVIKKRIPAEQAYRAFLIAFLSISLILVAFFIIVLIDNKPPLKTLFEIFSAFGTVGLSLGASSNSACSFSYDLSWLGKLVIGIVIFCGKLGTITIGGALLRPHHLEYSYPEEAIVVG